jgi:hypothetical protein
MGQSGFGKGRLGLEKLVRREKQPLMKHPLTLSSKYPMKSKNALCGLAIAVVLQLGVLAGSAQTNLYLFSGSLTNITLNPGTYIITAYGAPGGNFYGTGGGIDAALAANNQLFRNEQTRS